MMETNFPPDASGGRTETQEEDLASMKQASKITALLLAAVLLCAGCGNAPGKDAEATTMRLEKTAGEVTVWDEEKEKIDPVEKLLLYSGYQLFTEEESYGWISLDDTKLAKMDEESSVRIRKEDKQLKLTVKQGCLFFDITEPLSEDETMEIKVSNMIVGIRGTCGWISTTADLTAVYLLEGTVTCEIPREKLSVQVSAGEMACLVKGQEDRIEVKPFARTDIPRFVLEEIDDALINSIPESVPETETLPSETEAADIDIYTLPMSSEEFTDLIQTSPSGQTITIQAGTGDNTLNIDSFVSIDGHLILDEGVTLSIDENAQLNISGTLEVRSDVSNNGKIQLMSDASMLVDGTFTNSGLIVNGEWADKDGTSVAQNSRVIATQGIDNTGKIQNLGIIEGTVTVNDGSILMETGNLDRLILNDGIFASYGGTVGEFINNGGYVIYQ